MIKNSYEKEPRTSPTFITSHLTPWRIGYLDNTMKLAWKHLRHPLRTFRCARLRCQTILVNRKLLYQGDRHFKMDPRFDLTVVTQGFKDHRTDNVSDLMILERICKAYSLAMNKEQVVSAKYKPTPWWQQHRSLTLGPVMRALSTHDLETLQKLYENFFRDDCSTGLLPVQRLKNNYFGVLITDLHRRLYLVDALFRLDYWQAETKGRCGVRDLAGPTTGNPFGVLLGDTLIRTGSEYQHYCSQRIAHLLSERGTIAEIGGGFGGMAYYLLRDRPGTTYINFDLPESLSLAAYYLLKNFPNLKVILYGEADLTADTIHESDVILMPVFELERLPCGVADLSFSSHVLSDLAPDVMPAYLSEISRITRGHFLYVGSAVSANKIAGFSNTSRGQFMRLESRPSDWNRHIAPRAEHVECLYQISRVPPPSRNL